MWTHESFGGKLHFLLKISISNKKNIFQAENFEAALKLWQNLVKIHCSKAIDRTARERIYVADYDDIDLEIITDFEDECDDIEEKKYGSRKGIRANSPFLKIFQRFIDDIKDAEKDISNVDNSFYCLDLVEAMTKQYLSLFPFISATPLNGGLVTNCYVELHWKECRRVFKSIDKRLMWPLLYFTTLNNEYRNKGAERTAVKQVPFLKFGRPYSKKRISSHSKEQDSTDKDMFIPAPPKSKKVSKSRQDESVTGVKEMWTPKKDQIRSQEGKKQSYLVGKNLDYELILQKSSLPLETLKITASMTDDFSPQEIILSKADINAITSKEFVSNDVVDAMLSLVEKSFKDTVTSDALNFYTVQTLRIILAHAVERNLVKQGKFLIVLPRFLALNSYEERRKKAAKMKDILPGCHFTLVSNFGCNEGEVNVYETFEGFRDKDAILTEEGLAIVRILSNSGVGKLLINCVNVHPQEENECGLLACALAAQLCLNAPEDRAYLKKILNVRKTVLESLKEDCLVPFKTSGRVTRAQKTYLFSVKM